MTFTKSVLIFCLFHLLSLFTCDVIHREGVLLCKMRNLPHRGLGMLYYTYMKHPYRDDYARDYLMAYYQYMEDEMMVEGQKSPVVDMLTVKIARFYPWADDMPLFREYVMYNHFKKLSDSSEKPPIEGWIKKTPEVQ